MKKAVLLVLGLSVLMNIGVYGQSMHFSQYYNAPLLLNPANTGLTSGYDYRFGLNYRNQWAALPVPYNTFSAYGDFKIGGNSNNELHNNWLGAGFALFNDKAGDGNLSLFSLQGDLAYHLQLSEFTMFSLGFSGAIVQREVNFDNLTFDGQWDGLDFNKALPNNEKVGIMKTSYYTVGAGFNVAWFPNEAVYGKFGVSMLNVNKPVESFYGSTKNVIDYRPIAHLDMMFHTGPVLVINPSAYYTMQNGAAEIVVGSQFRALMSDKNETPVNLILGAYTRVGDAIIGVAGLNYGPITFMTNYDFTMSGLAPYNGSYGALEFSLVYQRLYHPSEGIKRMVGCPIF